jgi:VanZ family protein
MTNPPPRYRYRVLRFAVFAIVLALWTWKLLSPNPVPESVSSLISGDWRFWLAKSLHAGAYAFLTLLALTLPVPRYWRWYFVGLLAFHGAMTEVGQTFVPNRSGSVRDVLLDWLGIALASACWPWLRKRV